MGAKDAKSLNLLVLEGDGIGPEITAATLGVLRTADAKFALGLQFTSAVIGWAAHKAAGSTPSVAAVISGPMPSPSSTRRFRLFASLAPISASLPSYRGLSYLPF